MKQYLKYLFSGLSIGLTLISMHSGFYFYLTMFDVTTAVLATGVFEILRLTTLYSLVMWEVDKRLVSGILYAVVAFICAFAATSSFHARIIESHNADLKPYQSEVENRVTMIRQSYAEQMADKLSGIDSEIDNARKKVASRPNSEYWPKRIDQLNQNRNILLAERDSVLSMEPSGDLALWLDHHAAILGIELVPLPTRESGSAAISQAIQELWIVKELTVKKIVAILITFGIEVGIILLAVFARMYAQQDRQQLPESRNGVSSKSNNAKNKRTTRRKKEPVKEEAAAEEVAKPKSSFKNRALARLDGGKNHETIMEVLQTEFDETTIKKFISKVRPFYLEKGKLPSSRTLEKSMIPVRNALNSRFAKEELDQLFN